MNAVVVRKLSEREPVTPVCLLVIDKDPEILLDLLIYSFCLSVGLRVKGGGRVDEPRLPWQRQHQLKMRLDELT